MGFPCRILLIQSPFADSDEKLHLMYGGGYTLRTLKKYGDRVGYVHLKDVDGELLVK